MIEKNVGLVDFIEIEENALMDFQFAVLDELEARGWTQAQLAKELGVSRARVSQMLSADANPTLKLAARTLSVLGLKSSYVPSSSVAEAVMDQASRFAIFEAHSIEMISAWQSRPQRAANENYADAYLQAA